MSDSRCRSLSLEPEESGSLLGNIYIGKVKNIVKNINAAFIDPEEEKQDTTVSLRTGSIDSPAPGAAGHRRAGAWKQGDEIIVQGKQGCRKDKGSRTQQQSELYREILGSNAWKDANRIFC